MSRGSVVKTLLFWMAIPLVIFGVGWVVLPRLQAQYASEIEEELPDRPAPKLVKPPKVSVGVQKTEEIKARQPVSYNRPRRKKKTPVATATAPKPNQEAPPPAPIVAPASDSGGGSGETTPVTGG